MTDEVKADGQGIDIEIGQLIYVEFETEQIIDSTVFPSDTNIESYTISYRASNGDIIVLDQVIFNLI